jgi:agmatine/peptidylarginine deiminase
LRLLPEWVKQSFVWLNFPHKDTDWAKYLGEVLPTFELIALTIASYQKCLVTYKDENTIQNIKDCKNIILKKIDSNDTWCRDFGALSLSDGKNIELLDFIFNGWGNKFDATLDNNLSKQLFKNIKTIDFVLEGGSIDINSKGVLLTTSKCLLEKNRNPQYSKRQIEQKLKQYLGATKVLWLDYGFLEGDDTDSHIDMLARFIDDNTIVYQSFSKDDTAHYKESLKMQQQLKSFGYNLIALPPIGKKYYKNQRLPASYVNFLFINNAILIPTYNDKNDEACLDIFKNYFPKKDIIKIDCSKIIYEHGSLHCLSMQFIG